MKKVLKYMTFYDKVLVSFIIVVSLFYIFFPFRVFMKEADIEGENQVIVIKSEEEVIEIPVEETYTQKPQYIPVEGPTGITQIEAHEGRVRVKEEPEEHIYRIAEKQGWLDKTDLSTTIINMPNKIAIWIESRAEDEFDDEFDGIVY